MNGDDTTIPNWDSDDTTIPSEDTTRLLREKKTDITVGEFNKVVREQSYEAAVQLHGFDEILRYVGWDEAEASVRSVYNLSSNDRYSNDMTTGVLAYLGRMYEEMK